MYLPVSVTGGGSITGLGFGRGTSSSGENPETKRGDELDLDTAFL
jgi:hypothetical protein